MMSEEIGLRGEKNLRGDGGIWEYRKRVKNAGKWTTRTRDGGNRDRCVTRLFGFVRAGCEQGLGLDQMFIENATKNDGFVTLFVVSCQ